MFRQTSLKPFQDFTHTSHTYKLVKCQHLSSHGAIGHYIYDALCHPPYDTTCLHNPHDSLCHQTMPHAAALRHMTSLVIRQLVYETILKFSNYSTLQDQMNGNLLFTGIFIKSYNNVSSSINFDAIIYMTNSYSLEKIYFCTCWYIYQWVI